MNKILLLISGLALSISLNIHPQLREGRYYYSATLDSGQWVSYTVNFDIDLPPFGVVIIKHPNGTEEVLRNDGAVMIDGKFTRNADAKTRFNYYKQAVIKKAEQIKEERKAKKRAKQRKMRKLFIEITQDYLYKKELARRSL